MKNPQDIHLDDLAKRFANNGVHQDQASGGPLHRNASKTGLNLLLFICAILGAACLLAAMVIF